MTIAMSGYMYRGTKFLSPSPFLSFIQRLILSTNIPPKTNIHSQIPPSTVHLSFLNFSSFHYSSHVSRYLSLLLLSLAPIYISQALPPLSISLLIRKNPPTPISSLSLLQVVSRTTSHLFTRVAAPLLRENLIFYFFLPRKRFLRYFHFVIIVSVLFITFFFKCFLVVKFFDWDRTVS